MATLNVVCSFLSRPLCSPPPRHKCNVGLNVIWRNVHERTFFFPMVVRQNSRLKMHSAQYFDNCVSKIKICKNTNVHLRREWLVCTPRDNARCGLLWGSNVTEGVAKRNCYPIRSQGEDNTCYQRRLFGFLFLRDFDVSSERSSEKMWHTIHYGNANGTHSHGIHELIKKATANLM